MNYFSDIKKVGTSTKVPNIIQVKLHLVWLACKLNILVLFLLIIHIQAILVNIIG